MRNTLNEWYKQAERRTSGDMVYDILSDWEQSIIKYQTLLRQIAQKSHMGHAEALKDIENWQSCKISPCLDISTIIREEV